MTNLGDWFPFEYCDPGTFAVAIKTKVQPDLGSNHDNTAMNGIQLKCGSLDSSLYAGQRLITSGVGQWGDWESSFHECPKKSNGDPRYITALRLKVQPPQGSTDDTATNQVQARCEDGTLLDRK